MKLLKAAWEGWKRVALVIVDVQTAILLALVYWLVAGPMAVTIRLFGGLREFRGTDAESYWAHKPASPIDDKERLRFQF
jgi:hypothetical protein